MTTPILTILLPPNDTPAGAALRTALQAAIINARQEGRLDDHCSSQGLYAREMAILENGRVAILP